MRLKGILIATAVLAGIVLLAAAGPQQVVDPGSDFIALGKPVALANPILTRPFTWRNVAPAINPIPTTSENSFSVEANQTVSTKSVTGSLNVLGLFHVGGGASGASYSAQCFGGETFIVPEVTVPLPMSNGKSRFTVAALRVNSVLYRLDSASTAGLTFKGTVDKYYLNLAGEAARLPTDTDNAGQTKIITPSTPVPPLNCNSLDKIAALVQVADAKQASTGSASSSGTGSSPAPAAAGSPTPAPRTIDLAVDASGQNAAIVFGSATNVIVAVRVLQSELKSDVPHTESFSAHEPSWSPALTDNSRIHIFFQSYNAKKPGCVYVGASSTTQGLATPLPGGAIAAPPTGAPTYYLFCPDPYHVSIPSSFKNQYVPNRNYMGVYFPLFPNPLYLRPGNTSQVTQKNLDLSNLHFAFNKAGQVATISGSAQLDELSFAVTVVTKP